VGATNKSWNSLSRQAETFTAPPTCVASANQSIFLTVTTTTLGKSLCKLRDHVKVAVISATWQSQLLARMIFQRVTITSHGPSAERATSIQDSLARPPLSVAGHGIEHWRNPLNRVIQTCFASLSWGKYSCPFAGRSWELLSFVASRFPSLLLSTAISHPCQPSPVRFQPCSSNSRHKSRTRRR
jgi:hypothetical protein